MDRLPVGPVEWIDDLVFPQGAVTALNLHSQAALPAATAGHMVQQLDGLEPNDYAVGRNAVQSDATGCVVGGAGFEPAASSAETLLDDEENLLGTA